MKHNKRLIAFAACVFLLVSLFSVCWFVPVLRYEIFGIPIKTDVLFSPTDDATGFYAGIETPLSKAQSEKISRAFEALIAKGLSCEPITGGVRWSYKDGALVCLSFQYKYPYHYVGDLENLKAVGSPEFEALGMMIYETEMFIIKFSDTDNGRDEAYFALSLSEADIDSFVGIVAQTACFPNPMGIRREPIAAQPAVEEAKLFSVPSSMTVKNKERATELSAEQKDQIYDAFLRMQTMQALPTVGPFGRFEIYTPKAVYEEIDSNPCVEFRYEKRYRYTGTVAQILSENADEVPQDLELTVEFDSIVLILYDFGAMVIFGQNGLYKSAINVFYRQMDFGPGYADFRAEVLSLVE